MKKVKEDYKKNRHIVSALVNNKAGVLSRISGLFTRRGFNIESLTVGATNNEDISRMTIIVNGDDYVGEQFTKQLDKLIDVLKVKRISKVKKLGIVSIEILLVKIHITKTNKNTLLSLAKRIKAEILDLKDDCVILKVTAKPEIINEIIFEKLSKYKILEIARSGAVALEKGNLEEEWSL